MNELLLLSASELARRIRAGEVSSVEVVEAHIERLRTVNPRINALVAERFSEARREAREADRRLVECGPDGVGALHGVPCTIKEAFALAGMPWSGGLVSRRRVRAGRDAPAVARLRAAGAIPLGVTNLSELCLWMESHNLVYGRTRNPYDLRRTVGGSSGGEGAAIAAGGSPFGLGSDIGGSIRMPAFFCGVFGHKPSGGLVPNTDQFPNARGPVLRMLTTGPLCRRAEDLMPLLRLLAGPDGADSGCRELPLGDPATVSPARLRVLDARAERLGDVEPALLEAQDRAAAHLAGLGAQVVRFEPEGLERALLVWAARMHLEDGRRYKDLMAEGRPGGRARPWQELGRLALGRPRHTFPSIGLALLEDLAAAGDGLLRRALQRGREMKAALEAQLGQDGVMLFPSHPRIAPLHRRPMLRPFGWIYTGWLNALELPVTQVPLGLDRRGLPLGLQVVAGPGCDHLGIAVAGWLERGFGGWCPPAA